MADKILRQKRNLFIHSVGEGTINALLDDLLEDGVISQEEMYKVRYENCTVMDKARVLIDLVIGKGHRACLKFIKHIRDEDPELAWKLYLPSAYVVVKDGVSGTKTKTFTGLFSLGSFELDSFILKILITRESVVQP
nr:caspase recruitment domain-containing protein 18-like [Microcebus murinus]